MSIENHDPILLSHNMQAFTSTNSFMKHIMQRSLLVMGVFAGSPVHKLLESEGHSGCPLTVEQS